MGVAGDPLPTLFPRIITIPKVVELNVGDCRNFNHFSC